MSPRVRSRARVARSPGCPPWALALSMLIGGSASATAQVTDVSRFLGRPVTAVHLGVEGRAVQDEALLALVETHVSAPLTMAAVRESILHLFSLGRYEDVVVDAVASAAGVDLRFQLVPVHPVRAVEFRGDLGLSAGALRRAVTDRHGRTPDATRLDDMVRTVEEVLRNSGFMSPTLTARAEIDHVKEQTVLTFDVDAGSRARIGAFEIVGSSGGSNGRLPTRLGLVRGRPYDRVGLERRLEEYASELRDRGFYVATVEHAARVGIRGESVDLTITVDQGPRVVVTFVGDPLPADQRATLVEIRREGSIDEDLLEDSARRIVAYLTDQGYWRASADFRRREEDGLLEVIFDVSRGGLYRIAAVETTGADSVTTSDLFALVDVQSGVPFVQTRLDDAIVRLTGHYRRLGFSDVSIQGSVEETPSATAGPTVIARIAIDEGVRTRVASLRFEGNESASAADLTAQLGVREGVPFYAPDIVLSRDLILLHYLNRGYQSATVEARAEFRADRALCDVVFSVNEGAEIRIDHVLIVGNERIGSDTIRRELLLTSGDPLALDDLIESQRRLRALGVFRSVQITEITGTQSNARDLLVTVEESPATSIGYGGGLEAGRRLRRRADGSANEELEFAPRGFFEIGRRNLWGKNRSVDLFTRVSVRRGDDVQQTVDQSAGFGFNEYRVVGTFREPRPFGWNAEFLTSAFFEQAIRSSFNFNRRGVNTEIVRRLTPEFNLSARYSFDRTRLFDERINPADELLIDRLFPKVRLSKVSTAIVRDTRADPLDPRNGNLLSVEAELAGRGIGSEVGFAKALFQGFLYRQLPQGRVVLAIGARVGLAVGFPRNVVREDESGNPRVDSFGQPLVDEVDDLPASERFFAGGDSTVRGFALDRLGTTETIDSDGFPKGGNALIIVNAELRMPVWRDVGAVIFLDAGNVFARLSRFDVGEIRGSVGFGVRYRSPVGPIRVDLGFKLDRRRFANDVREPRTALHVSIGQAF